MSPDSGELSVDEVVRRLRAVGETCDVLERVFNDSTINAYAVRGAVRMIRSALSGSGLDDRG